MNLAWGKCGTYWCNLLGQDFQVLADLIGVYVIWHTGTPARVVRVGQGIVRERLAAHQGDPEITSYTAHGDLRVTWAPQHQLDGVEAFLAQRYQPLVGERFPNVTPIPVNLPG